MEYTGKLVTGDFEDNTMTFEIEGEMKLQAGKYKIVQIEAGNQVKNNVGLAGVRRSYLVKFVDPSKEYDVTYLAPHQSESGNREEGIFTLKGEDLTEKQILQLFLREAL